MRNALILILPPLITAFLVGSAIGAAMKHMSGLLAALGH